MPGKKVKFMKKSAHTVQESNINKPGFDVDRKFNEDVRESEEGIDVEDDDASEEIYPEIEDQSEHEDRDGED